MRQAGDVLDVQTLVLTKWLREAGVHVTRGTLTGEPPTGPTGSSSSTSTATTTADPGAMVADAAAHPVSALNELVQAGALEPLAWEVQAVTRPGVHLVHTACVTTRIIGTEVEVVGEGAAPAKAGARAAAAADLRPRLQEVSPAR